MKIKIKNKTKFIGRILEILIIIATIFITILSIKYANRMRGYNSVGGEYLIPIIPLIVILLIEEKIEKSEERRK